MAKQDRAGCAWLAKFVAPMIERFMATDRGFCRLRREKGLPT
ncbi:DUF2274 domain-containing protein [Pinisolibacter aquiterrae]